MDTPECKGDDATRCRVVGIDVGTARMGVAVLDLDVRPRAVDPEAAAAPPPRRRKRCAYYSWGPEPVADVLGGEVVHAFASRVEKPRAGDPLWPPSHTRAVPPDPAPRRETPARSASGSSLEPAIDAWVEHHAPAIVASEPDVVVVEHQSSRSMLRVESLLIHALRARLPRRTRVVRVHPALKTMGNTGVPPAGPRQRGRRRRYGPPPERHAMLKACAHEAACKVVAGGAAGEAWAGWLGALPISRGRWDVSDAIMHAHNYAVYCGVPGTRLPKQEE